MGDKQDIIELMKVEAQIVRNYEILLTAIFAGVIASSYFLYEKQEMVALIFISIVSFSIAANLSIGRSFHYALYESFRNKIMLANSISKKKIEDKYNCRKKILALPTLSSTCWEYWVFWPVISAFIPLALLGILLIKDCIK